MTPRLAVAVAALVGGFWLSVAATDARADGGPHQVAVNSGTTGLSGDCAGCHRAHTAQATDLLKAALPGLCLTCHDGTGATTDVVNGIQFVPDGAGDPTGQVLGALRGGGFSYALIDSGNAARLIASGRFLGKVGVLAVGSRQPVTSTHGADGTVWGNGPDGTAGAGAGPAELTCTGCHNPHGNGQYRILLTTPGEDWGALGVPGWQPPANQVEVADIANPGGGVRNYTVLPGILATDAAAYLPTQGDYWRWRSPWNLNTGFRDPMQSGWNGISPTNAAANGGTPPTNASGLMTAWCVSCHTRYSGLVNANGESSSLAPQPDAIFTYRHLTMNVGCLQCHVGHGSNAGMTGAGSFGMSDPAGAPVPGGSRLLKVDDRGTCQLCHDPTGTAGNGYVGPIPSPGVP